MSTRLAALVLAGLLAACAGGRPAPARGPAGPTVTGFAELPGRTLAPGPPSGAFLDPVPGVAGAPAFRSQPVGNFTGLVALSERELLAVTGAGFGLGAPSADFLLRLYRLRVDWEDGRILPGASHDLRDPRGHLPFPTAGRPLTGAELDPGSLARAYDGTLWIGEARGPWVLHVSPTGELLEAPLAVPVPPALAPYARGLPVLRSPDHPALAGREEAARLRGANLPAGAGLAGLAVPVAAKRGYVVPGAPLLDDPDRRRVPVLELDVEAGRFTGRWWWYRLEDPAHRIADVAAAGAQTLVVIEADDRGGREARTKRVYEVRLDRTGAEGRLEKRLVADLLALDDPDDLGPSSGGRLRLAARRPDAAAVLDPTTLVIGTDDDFPFGRSRGDGAEATELVRIALPRALR